jgi:NAD-dependent SIR2 family protein deacetylase
MSFVRSTSASRLWKKFRMNRKEDASSYGPWGKAQEGPPTIGSVARLLGDDKGDGPRAKKVVIMAGAGISTASGIPDFRSPKTGLYANLKKYNLPYPEAIFDIDYFQRKPQPFFTLSKELYPGNFKPTLTHSFFKLLDDKGKLLRVFTQNIDTLERIAGLDGDRIVEAHGSFATSRCIRCKKQVEPEWIRDKVMQGQVARCPQKSCQAKTDGEGGLVKPDIVFFGEGLPDRFFRCMSDLKQADLLIVVGTSLQVQPFASLIDHVSPSCPRLLLNLERVGEIASFGGGGSSGLDKFLGGMKGLMNETGFDFEGWTLGKGRGKQHIRDVFYEGKCDEGVMSLAEELGWAEELRMLHRKTCDMMDKNSFTSMKKVPVEEGLKEAERKAGETAKHVSDAQEAEQDQEIASIGDKLSKIDVNGVSRVSEGTTATETEKGGKTQHTRRDDPPS